ncbi:hypothetical protein [Mesorhizobium sp. B2-3-2]|uniref:hypothetical protein n=1 Tax=Mesorhizobium sp. B2-3-2 TaxID=2589961 RepID=UPI00112B5C69|nr:hypothetical protein [Mesorhizobium sp. B2-3-2]TPM37065.1 hypothetical protein FJ964_30495 [Mesorhizobium sp. B2-3-2]
MGPRSRAVHDKSYQILVNGELELETDHFAMARAAFDAAPQCFTNSTLVLKNGARVMETVKTGRYDHQSRRVEILSLEK